MVDMFTKNKRSEIMSGIRSKNTIPELLLFDKVKYLYKIGFRYVKHNKKVFGKPDLSFKKQKVAVFVDSEFWHGKDFDKKNSRLPKTYWRDKINNNTLRDKKVNQYLKGRGWKVIRIWAGDFVKKPGLFIQKIEKELKHED